MTSAATDPYQILGSRNVKTATDQERDLELRLCYRQRILEYTIDRAKPSDKRKITAADFRLICRAYETLGDRDKRKRYDETGQWVRELAIEDYDLHQLAAEPELIDKFRVRVHNATLKEISKKQGFAEQTALYCAARACNTEAVEFLAEQDADPDITQKTGSTALHAAAFFGHARMVECLLSCGANYNAKNMFGNLPEIEGNEPEIQAVFGKMKKNPYVRVAAGDFNWLEENLNSTGQHVDFQYFKLRQTLLHCAAKKGYMNIVESLVKTHKANLDITDINGNTALHLAAHRGYGGIVKYLIENGADAKRINKWTFTAEDEGKLHGEDIQKIFKAVKNSDMYRMAAEGCLWWFQYHFDVENINNVSATGATVLYISSRYGHLEIVNFLLDNNAHINAKLENDSGSTALHGAVYHNHVDVARLLLARGADINARNSINENIFGIAKSDAMRKVLEDYRSAMKQSRILTVHIFGDGKTSGDKPQLTLNLPLDATLRHLQNSVPDNLKDKFSQFTVARRPLPDNAENEPLVSLICRCRYGKTIFIDSPLCLIGDRRQRFGRSGYTPSPGLDAYSSRHLEGIYSSEYKKKTFVVSPENKTKQVLNFGNLSLTFNVDSVSKNVNVKFNYVQSPKQSLNDRLPGCVFFFHVSCEPGDECFNEMPEVSLLDDMDSLLYIWVQGTAHWLTHKGRGQRLLTMNGYFAFIKHVTVIPFHLSLPHDMIIANNFESPLQRRQTPVLCKYLEVRKQDSTKFPRIAYHGTSVAAVQSILMDSLVMPSTVVSSGLRIVPPSYHIARGVKAFGVDDFSNAIFVSPSIHYCADPAYAQLFKFDDKIWIAILECSVKDDSFEVFASTVPGYNPHPEDDVNAIEWRITNPAAIEILSVIFIEQQMTRVQAAKLRAEKLGIVSAASS